MIPGAYILTGFPQSLNQDFSPYRAWVGFALFLGALMLFPRHAQGARTELVGDAGGPPQEHTLVTDSVYRLVRHPWISILAVGAGAGLPAAKLVRRPQWSYRLRRLCIPDWTWGPADARALGPVWDAYVARSWPLLPLLH